MATMATEVSKSLMTNKSQIDKNFLSAIEENENIISQIYLLINCYLKRGEDFGFDELLNEITHDIFASIYFCLQGFYRQSYISLRCILEMGISLFNFKDNNYDYLLWKQNKKDIIWSRFKRENEGILIKQYWELFFEGNFEIFLDAISFCYRECSEYVHGKDEYLKSLKDFQVRYNKDICENILKMCENIISLLIVGTSIRFGNHSDEYYNKVYELQKEYEVIKNEH